EPTGAVVHELGHALGVTGHASATDDPLAAGAGAARRAGARALAGEPIASATVAALYAQPPGAVFAHTTLDEWRTAELDRFVRLAHADGFDGPFLRAGDAVGRIFWRDAHGRELGFRVPDLARRVRDPLQP